VDIMRVRDSAGAVLWRLDKDGYPILKKTAAPADASLNANEVALWFDATNGSAKLMIKAKQANGTVVVGEIALA
jgi:hypothetical protein